jgi:hypothetical protein
MQTLLDRNDSIMASTQGFYSTIKNNAVIDLGISPWQRLDLVYRRLEEHAMWVLKTQWEGHPLLQVQTPEDVLKEFYLTLGKTGPSYEPWNTWVSTLAADSPHDNRLKTMSASSFFWALFVDKYLYEDLTEEVKLGIVDAYFFACWKEHVENVTLLELLKQCRTLDNLIQRMQHYLERPEKDDEAVWGGKDFQEFRSSKMSLQNPTVEQGKSLTQDQVLYLLRVSPWCPVHQIMLDIHSFYQTSEKNGKLKVKRKMSLRIHSESLLQHVRLLMDPTSKAGGSITKGESACFELQKHADKRMLEYRFRLALIVTCALPRFSHPTQEALKGTVAAARHLMTRDVTVNFTGTVSNFAEVMLKQKPVMERVLMGALPLASKVAAEFITQTWLDLWGRIYHNRVTRALILVSVASRGGLFLSQQRALIDTLASMVRFLLQELL